jgi:transcriptional regulator with XRE-family HTH domain
VSDIDIRNVLLGRIIKQSRRNAKLTQEMVASATGLSRPSIANIEAGKQAVHWAQLCDLARVLKFDLNALISDEGVTAEELLDNQTKAKRLADEKRAAERAQIDAQIKQLRELRKQL